MDDKPSKSARKRAAQAIRAMADELVDLKPQVLEALIKDNDLLHAIREAQQTNSHGALRRQKQYIARLMRELDHDEIRDALDALAGDPAKEKQLFRRAESLRDALLDSNGSEQRQILIANSLGNNEPLIAELSRHANAANDRDRKAAAKRVFRALHAALAAP